jgi:tripartite-type tricarboxylate transporter receptor subunit TctC
MLLSRGDATVFLTHPISGTLIAITVALLVYSVASAIKARRRAHHPVTHRPPQRDHRTMKHLLALGAAAILLATPALAAPGKWSDEPVRIVVTFPPGGASDLIARILAKYFESEYGQRAVVDNRPGAGGTVAAGYVAGQAPDGTTLILGNNAPFTVTPSQFDTLPYDPLGSFSHIAYLGASTPALFVQPNSGITTLVEYIAEMKTDGVTDGSSGVGSITHILGKAVDIELGIEQIHVPYQGGAPAIQDFRAGVLEA